MSDQWLAYVKDSRTICKYGSKCYQKSPQHHGKYKHPPHHKRKKTSDDRVSKKLKTHEKEDSEKPHASAEYVESKQGAMLDQTRNINTNIDPDQSSNSNHNIDTYEHNSAKLPEVITFYDCQSDNKNLIKELFLVDMPPDFYTFYKCLIEEKQDINEILHSVNLELIGPYDLLQGKLPIVRSKDLYLLHWRFFFDPPEFQTVLKCKGKSQYHIGYYRDSPDDPPVFIASNDSSKDCTITPLSENIFGAVYAYLQREKKQSPFTSIACQKFMEKVKKWAEEHNFSLDEYNIKKRRANVSTKTFHGAGIVVPFNKTNRVGYRPLVESDANIKKIFAKIKNAKSPSEIDEALSELQPIITYADIAVDECDFGTGLEIGINLFCSGLEVLEASALNSFCAAYGHLKREAFAKIIKAHLKHRRKGPDMSLLNIIDK